MPEARSLMRPGSIRHLPWAALLFVVGMAGAADPAPVLEDYEALDGFIDLYWDEHQGRLLATVVPDARAVTVHIHHSIVRLPDSDYVPLPYDPRSGVTGLRYDAGGFADYATAIGDSMTTDYGRRHRPR